VRVVVFGAGAIGSLLAAYLDRSGQSVLLVGRPAHVHAVRESGLRLEGQIEGVFRLDAATELPVGSAPDAVFLTVKTFDLADAAGIVARRSRPGTPVLLPQNGLGVKGLAGNALRAGGWSDPEGAMVRAVNSLPATWVEPGRIRVAGSGEILLPEAKGPASAAIEIVGRLLRDAGLPVRSTPDLRREVWRKAVVNAAINPLSALRGVPNGRLLEPPLRAEADRLLEEAVRAARAAGIELTVEEATVDFERVARATAENRSSMLQDLDRGGRTEIDAISGEILRVGEHHGLDLPATRAVIAEVESRGPRPEERR
jgi:2-dehydropantoate 2-reductase